jgi:hypothetical protein
MKLSGRVFILGFRLLPQIVVPLKEKLKSEKGWNEYRSKAQNLSRIIAKLS